MAIFNGTIKNILKNDLAAVEKILDAWLSKEETKHYLQFISDSIDETNASLQFDSHYLVTESADKKIIGVLGYRKPITKMLTFATTEYPAELNMLYVLPEKRGGQGVGTALINELEKILIQKKYTEILVRSAKKFEKTGWGFYDQLPGFERVGILKEPDKTQLAQIWHKIIK